MNKTPAVVPTQRRKLILRNHQSPGDVLLLTAAVRDLHKACPGRFVTDIRTSVPDIWENNPYVTRLDDKSKDCEAIECHYPLVSQSNQRPYHFIHGFVQDLEAKLDVRIPITEFKGEIHLSEQEKGWINQVEEQFGFKGKFWVMMAGGKTDFTCKWWNPASYQAVVDHFKGRVQFVQCGDKAHWHPPLHGVFNLVGRTDIRQFIRLMYHAAGVVCPVTFAMHLAAAVPTKGPGLRPAVVIAGGRESPHWEAYPGHQFLHTIGALKCCASGGCWRSRCQKVGDGDQKDTAGLCDLPVQVRSDLVIPRCMDMIKPKDVTRAMEMYVQ